MSYRSSFLNLFVLFYFYKRCPVESLSCKECSKIYCSYKFLILPCEVRFFWVRAWVGRCWVGFAGLCFKWNDWSSPIIFVKCIPYKGCCFLVMLLELMSVTEAITIKFIFRGKNVLIYKNTEKLFFSALFHNLKTRVLPWGFLHIAFCACIGCFSQIAVGYMWAETALGFFATSVQLLQTLLFEGNEILKWNIIYNTFI